MSLSFYNFLPECVASFLDAPDLISFATTNRSMYNKVEKNILDQKKQKMKEILPLFHRPESLFVSESFNLRYGVLHHENKIKSILSSLPEVFSYIQEKGIHSLDLGLATIYGGYPLDISVYIPDKSHIAIIISKLLTGLKWNTTLKTCNLGLFQQHLDRDRLFYTVYRHPSLDWVTLRTNEIHRTRFREPPHTIYLKEDRTAVWANFRPDN